MILTADSFQVQEFRADTALPTAVRERREIINRRSYLLRERSAYNCRFKSNPQHPSQD